MSIVELIGPSGEGKTSLDRSFDRNEVLPWLY